MLDKEKDSRCLAFYSQCMMRLAWWWKRNQNTQGNYDEQSSLSTFLKDSCLLYSDYRRFWCDWMVQEIRLGDCVCDLFSSLIIIIFLLNSILLSNGIPSVVYLKEIRFHEFLEVVYYFQGSVSLHCHLGNPLYAVNKIWKQKPCLFYLNLGISVPLICHYIINRTFPNGGKLHYFYHQILVVPDIILSSY